MTFEPPMLRPRQPPAWMLAIAASWAASGCDGAQDEPPAPYPGEELAGGDATVFDDTRLAFALAFPNLDHDARGDHFVGNSFFNQNWVQAPASTDGRDGLGPLFNAKSCSGCHFRDGRGTVPASVEDEMLGAIVRLSVPGPDGMPVDEPTYGDQLQSRSIGEVPAEGRVIVHWEEVPGAYDDGEAYSLRRPTIELVDLDHGPLSPGTMTSLRVAPAMIGLGLLEAIPASDLEALADPDDRDEDGISGRLNHPLDPATGQPGLGRFGWKANQGGIVEQVTGAFSGDLGITTSLRPQQSCTPAQSACGAAPAGGTPEAGDDIVAFVTFYSRTLAVPARRDVDDVVVLRGRELFDTAGCTTCHVPSHRTEYLTDDLPQVADQTIWPYTDLLLHDMGEGLADGRPDVMATGREWRTPPLWGLGLVPTVNGHDTLLHDGRARGAAEAILWHSGEAEASRQVFAAMSADEREALLAFLGSL